MKSLICFVFVLWEGAKITYMEIIHDIVPSLPFIITYVVCFCFLDLRDLEAGNI